MKQKERGSVPLPFWGEGRTEGQKSVVSKWGRLYFQWAEGKELNKINK